MRQKENINKEGKIGGQTEFWDDEVYISAKVYFTIN